MSTQIIFIHLPICFTVASMALEQLYDFPCVHPTQVLTNTSGKTIHPDSKVPGANVGPTWGQQAPGGAHVGPMNPAICTRHPFLGRTRVMSSSIMLHLT